MPTPLEILLDPISLVILAFYAAMMLWEAFAPGRDLPKMKGWILRGLTSFVVYFYLASYLPLIWDEYLMQFQLMDLSSLGTFGGAVVGILAFELFTWAWHWSMHKSDFLWRTVHQMHHSAERIDTYSAFYFSPLDMVGWTLLSSLCFALVMGLNAQANTIILLVVNFLAIFQHSNVKTPYWLGYIIQRPESHSIHHGRGVHEYNYADLPLIDIIFRTFRNPKNEVPQTGFYEGASSRIADMLMFKDISQPASN